LPEPRVVERQIQRQVVLRRRLRVFGGDDRVLERARDAEQRGGSRSVGAGQPETPTSLYGTGNRRLTSEWRARLRTRLRVQVRNVR
jgi:hypothetical protein